MKCSSLFFKGDDCHEILLENPTSECSSGRDRRNGRRRENGNDTDEGGILGSMVSNGEVMGDSNVVVA